MATTGLDCSLLSLTMKYFDLFKMEGTLLRIIHQINVIRLSIDLIRIKMLEKLHALITEKVGFGFYLRLIH